MNIIVTFYMNRGLGHVSLVIYNQNLKTLFRYWGFKWYLNQYYRVQGLC